MVVSEGVRSTDPNAKSLFERITMASRETLCHRLLIWAVMITLVSIAVKFFLPAPCYESIQAASTSMLVMGMCVGFGGALYLLARFVLSFELRHILMALAFTTFGVGMGLQALLDVRMPGALYADWVSTVSWAMSALLFLFSAYVNTTCQGTSRRFMLMQSLFASALVLLSPLLAIPYVVGGSLNTYLAGLAHKSLLFQAADLLIKLASIVFFTVALSGFYRRAHEKNERTAGLLCFTFVPLLAGLLFQLISTQRFDEWQTLSLIFESVFWSMLMGGFCIENAIMQREVQDRLHELDALDRVSWSIVGAGSVRDLLDMFARTHQERLGVKVAAVYLADATGENLELFAIRGPQDCPGTVGNKYPVTSTNRWPGFHSGHTAKAFLTKEIQVANDVFVDVEFVSWRMVAADDGCAVSLPLVSRGNAIGVVNLYYGDCRSLTRQRLRLLSTIAASAAPAIASALERESDSLTTELDIAA